MLPAITVNFSTTLTRRLESFFEESCCFIKNWLSRIFHYFFFRLLPALIILLRYCFIVLFPIFRFVRLFSLHLLSISDHFRPLACLKIPCFSTTKPHGNSPEPASRLSWTCCRPHRFLSTSLQRFKHLLCSNLQPTSTFL